MGMPSVGILLHEIIKLMFHAKVVDPVFFRIGTSGGIGMEGGTVIISDEAVDGTLQPQLELVCIKVFIIYLYLNIIIIKYIIYRTKNWNN